MGRAVRAQLPERQRISVTFAEILRHETRPSCCCELCLACRRHGPNGHTRPHLRHRRHLHVCARNPPRCGLRHGRPAGRQARLLRLRSHHGPLRVHLGLRGRPPDSRRGTRSDLRHRGDLRARFDRRIRLRVRPQGAARRQNRGMRRILPDAERYGIHGVALDARRNPGRVLRRRGRLRAASAGGWRRLRLRCRTP